MLYLAPVTDGDTRIPITVLGSFTQMSLMWAGPQGATVKYLSSQSSGKRGK